MSRLVNLETEGHTWTLELNDSATADQLVGRLPLEVRMSRWGDEYYGDAGLDVEEEAGARTEMAVGEVAVWPDGKALCIFFGPTPASVSDEPRAISPVNPVGRLLEDVAPLNGLGQSIHAVLSARTPDGG